MTLTKHALHRSQQRTLSEDLANLAIMYGEQLSSNSTRYLISEKNIRHLKKERIHSKKLLKKAEKAAPYVCVYSEERVITIFRVNRRINRRYKK